ncbi:DEKNAAC104686 [Brettanomyces naardenensis]|uniref:DEKNAAC104686 n=1 Tax=Brettanomyces naardenensis TaxID=13370 RepID=A0A448YRQ2_BRENA|nr:DEKNAAC104686 [Brettanomyces naardenensis]
MAILTNVYLGRLQPSPHRFGMLVNSEYKHGVVEEMIKMNDREANKRYLRCLFMLARANGLAKDDEEGDITDTDDASIENYNVADILLGDDQLDKWYYDKKDLNYISGYCDLILRYALTLPNRQSDKVEESISRCFEIIERYEKLGHKPVGSYALKNKALRTEADIMKYKGEDFAKIEECFLRSIRLVEDNEFQGEYPSDREVSIIPDGERSGNNLTNSLLDLCSFYTDTRQPKYMSKALSILISELRSLERECKGLDRKYDSNALYSKKGLKSEDERRLMELKFERIPLIKMEISEILWYGQHFDKAIDMAKDSAQQSSMYSHSNFNSAKIAKMGFANLSKMYHKKGDDEAAQLCQLQSDGIEIPLDAFITPSSTVRDAVLGYWFGSWGRFLFPG